LFGFASKRRRKEIHSEANFEEVPGRKKALREEEKKRVDKNQGTWFTR